MENKKDNVTELIVYYKSIRNDKDECKAFFNRIEDQRRSGKINEAGYKKTMNIIRITDEMEESINTPFDINNSIGNNVAYLTLILEEDGYTTIVDGLTVKYINFDDVDADIIEVTIEVIDGNKGIVKTVKTFK